MSHTVASLQEDMACPDCPAEVLVTQGANAIRIRVVHAGTCPWHARHRAGLDAGCVPCGCVVTHRGPYKRPRPSGGAPC